MEPSQRQNGDSAHNETVSQRAIVTGINTGGRPRQYDTNAARQRAFRQRQRAAKQIKACGPQTLRRGLIWYAPLGLFGGMDLSNTRHAALSTTNATVVAGGPPLGCAQGGGWAE